MAEFASVVCDSSGTINAPLSHGVTSVTKSGTGVYDIVWDYDYGEAEIKCMITILGSTPGIATYVITQLAVGPADVGGVTVYTWDMAGVAADFGFNCVADREG